MQIILRNSLCSRLFEDGVPVRISGLPRLGCFLLADPYLYPKYSQNGNPPTAFREGYSWCNLIQMLSIQFRWHVMALGLVAFFWHQPEIQWGCEFIAPPPPPPPLQTDFQTPIAPHPRERRERRRGWFWNYLSCTWCVTTSRSSLPPLATTFCTETHTHTPHHLHKKCVSPAREARAALEKGLAPSLFFNCRTSPGSDSVYFLSPGKCARAQRGRVERITRPVNVVSLWPLISLDNGAYIDGQRGYLER